eukprot:11058196-Ditylum_brightwellii.AAC.1
MGGWENTSGGGVCSCGDIHEKCCTRCWVPVVMLEPFPTTLLEYMSIRSSIVRDLVWGPIGSGVMESLGWGVILVECLGKYLLNDVEAEHVMVSRGVDVKMLQGELLMDCLDQELTPCVDCALACSNICISLVSPVKALVEGLTFFMCWPDYKEGIVHESLVFPDKVDLSCICEEVDRLHSQPPFAGATLVDGVGGVTGRWRESCTLADATNGVRKQLGKYSVRDAEDSMGCLFNVYISIQSMSRRYSSASC